MRLWLLDMFEHFLQLDDTIGTVKVENISRNSISGVP